MSEQPSQVAQAVKKLPASAGDVRDVGSIPRLGRSPGGGHGNPLKYSCLENPMDRRAWWATVHGVAKSQTGLSNLAHAVYLSTPFLPGLTKPSLTVFSGLCYLSRMDVKIGLKKNPREQS